MGLFSKPKVPGIDTGALTRITEQNATTQRDLLGRRKQALLPLQEKFKTDRAAFSSQIEPGAESLVNRYATDLQGVGGQERAANQSAVIAQREQSFRDVPEIQRAIRESLGGGGLLQSGVASRELSRPILDAARSSRDFSTGLETEQLGRESQRAEGLASTGYGSRTAALDKRLGVDESTLNTLASSGREDLIKEYEDLAGIESDLGSSRLGIEQVRQANNAERAKASAARRGQIMSTLGTVAGGVAGSFGGPLGAGIGAQLGGSLGNLAGGGSGGQLDPTLLFALAQNRANNPTTNNTRSNVLRSLGSQPGMFDSIAQNDLQSANRLRIPRRY